MMAPGGGRTWLRRMPLALCIVVFWAALPFIAVRAGISLLMRIDGRHAFAEQALSSRRMNAQDSFGFLHPAAHGYAILQRQVLRHPAGILYAIAWEEGDGHVCVSNAFVERIRDVLGGWKGREARGHCIARDYSAGVAGAGEYDGFSVASGLSGDAALVKVTWRTGDVTYTRPIGGAFMAALERHGAQAAAVEFLAASGDLLHSIRAGR